MVLHICLVLAVLRYLLIGGIVAGAMFFAMVVSLMSVLCYRRCEHQDNGRTVRYQGKTAFLVNPYWRKELNERRYSRRPSLSL